VKCIFTKTVSAVVGLLLAIPGTAAVQAVATTTMVADLVRSVGGSEVAVRGLMEPGVDPHLYRPTRQDVTALQRADVIFYNGLHLEGRMTDVLEMMAKRGRAVVAVAERVPEDKLLSPEEFEGVPDPHVWFDPLLWAATVSAVVEGLAAADPDNRETYVARGEAVVTQLQELDSWVRQRVEVLSPAKRVLITSHDAYNYFGRAYGFRVIGVQGISTVSEAGLADMARIVEFIKNEDVKAVFFESSVSDKLVRRISEDSGAAVGGELFSDAMGVPGKIETFEGESYDVGTYLGMVKHNVNQIVAGLR